MITITRKIQLNLISSSEEEKKEKWQQLYLYRTICRNAANISATHRFTLDNIKQFLYLTENVKYKLADINKKIDDNNNDGENCKKNEGIPMLETSQQNAIYQTLSLLYKGKIYTDILAQLNNNIYKTYNSQKNDYFLGNRSLTNYKKEIPIPFSSSKIKNLIWNTDKKCFQFDLFDWRFYTYLGKDRSGNKSIIDKCITGEFKLCDSSLLITNKYKDTDKQNSNINKKKKNKIFLLLTFRFEPQKIILNKDKILNAELGIDNPIECYKTKVKPDEPYYIGSKEDYLYKRLQIQNKLHNLQKSCKYNTGGHGRNHKLQALDRFHLKEKNFISNKLHNYSRQLINFAIKNSCGTINLVEIDDKILNAKENPYILRNWSYYGFIEKIKYKANMHGINLIGYKEKDEENTEDGKMEEMIEKNLTKNNS